MFRWLRKYPCVGMLIPLIAGILCSYFLSVPSCLLIVLSACAVLLLLTAFVWKLQREKLLWLCSFTLLLVFGLWHSAFSWHKTDWLADSQPHTYKVQVTDYPVEKTASYQTPVRLLLQTDSVLQVMADKKAILYLPKDSAMQVPQPGDLLLVRTAISLPLPADDYSFDYGRYLRLQGMVGTGYVQRGGWLTVGHETLKGLLPFSRRIRTAIESHFSEIPLRERAVLQALVLGDRSLLDADTRAAFAESGAMHVLAVSGLHVGIIAGMLVWLVTLGGFRKPLYKDKTRQYIQTTIVIASLAFYALLTGLSPSVLRSVLMFSLISIGVILRPQSNHYNIVAASALLILLMSPLALFQSGFLLSYSAVLSILRFGPSLDALFPRLQKHKLLKYFYSLLSVSLVAQLGTLPWTILFFHRVSNYFALTNIGVLPLVQYIIIPSFFLFLVLMYIPVIGPLMGKLLGWEIWCLNSYVGWIQSLPGSSFEVAATPLLTALMLLLVVCFAIRSRWRWIPACGFLLAFAVALFCDYRQAAQETDIRVYQRSGNVAVMAREGRSATLLTTDSVFALSQTREYRLCRHVDAVVVQPVDTTLWRVVFRCNNQPFMLEKNRYGRWKYSEITE